MKKTYKKPTVEIEVYSLDTSIASNCIEVVTNGPEMGNHTPCAEFIDPWRMADERLGLHNVQFYPDTKCDCYTTSGTGEYWTS